MDYEKRRLTPITQPSEDDDSAARREARAQLQRFRSDTARFKQRYFEQYDDVKISHREDW